MKLYRVEIIGTWDVVAESEDEAREIMGDALPPREGEKGIASLDCRLEILGEEET